VFLGANQDSYATTHDLAMAPGSVSNFEATPAGVAAACAALSANESGFRSKPRAARIADESRFWETAGKPEG